MKVLRIVPEKCTGCMRCRNRLLLYASRQLSGLQVGDPCPAQANTSFSPYTCTQCDEGWCMTACPVEAITISPAGAKIVLEDQCVKRKLCTIALPVAHLFYNRKVIKPSNHNLCHGQPALSQRRPTAAIEYVEAETADWLGDFAAQRAKTDLVGLGAGR